MSYSSIQMDFNEAKAQATKLEGIADDMRRLANQQLTNTIQELSSAWSGETASAYFGKAEKVKSSILTSAQNLDTVARNIRTQAKRIYDAEMAALRLAEERAAAAAAAAAQSSTHTSSSGREFGGGSSERSSGSGSRSSGGSRERSSGGGGR